MLGSLDLAAALLLLAAGLGKLRAPAPATVMLRRAVPRRLAGLTRPALVRAGGLAEVAVAVAVAVTGSRVALALLAAAYLCFLAVSLRLAAAGQRTSCGCFGRTDSPVGPAHVALNAVAAASAIGGTIRPSGPWGGRFAGDVLPGVIGVAQAGLLAAAGYLAITALPALSAERRRVAS